MFQRPLVLKENYSQHFLLSHIHCNSYATRIKDTKNYTFNFSLILASVSSEKSPSVPVTVDSAFPA